MKYFLNFLRNSIIYINVTLSMKNGVLIILIILSLLTYWCSDSFHDYAVFLFNILSIVIAKIIL